MFRSAQRAEPKSGGRARGWGRPPRGGGRKAPWPGTPTRLAEWYGPAELNPRAGQGVKASGGGAMGLRAAGALGRAGAGPGAPEGPRPSGGAQGGSIHSGCIAAVHNVPLSVLIRPLPSVLDPAKVQSLVDTIRVRLRGRRPEGGRRRRQVALDARGSWFGAPPEHSIYCVTLSTWLGLSGPQFPHLNKQGIDEIIKIKIANIKIALFRGKEQF